MTGYLLKGIMYEGVTVEKPDIELFSVMKRGERIWLAGSSEDNYTQSLNEWNRAIASAPQLPAIGFADGEEGVIGYEHGYQILRSIVNEKDDIWKFTDRVDFYQTVKHGRRIVAIPLKQPKEASTLPDKQPDEYPFKTLQEEHDHLMTFNQEPDNPESDGKTTVGDLLNNEAEKELSRYESNREYPSYYHETNMLSMFEAGAIFAFNHVKNHPSQPTPLPVNEAAKERYKYNESFSEWPVKLTQEQLTERERAAFVAGYAFAKGENK